MNICMDMSSYNVQQRGHARIMCAHIKEQASFHICTTLDRINVFTRELYGSDPN